MKAVFLFLAIFLQTLVLAQTTYQVKADIINIYDGLAVNRVSRFAFDDAGNLWIGTTDGLSVYDGFDVKNFDSSNSIMTSDDVAGLIRLPDCRMAMLTNAEGSVNQITGLYTLTLNDGIRFEAHEEILQKDKLGPLGVADWEDYHDDGFYFRNTDTDFSTYSIQHREWIQVEVPEGFRIICFKSGHVFGRYRDSIYFFKGIASDSLHDMGDLEGIYPHLDKAWPVLKKVGFDDAVLLKTITYDPVREVIWVTHQNRLVGVDHMGRMVRFGTGNDFYELNLPIDGSPRIAPDGSLVLLTSRGLHILRLEPMVFQFYHADRTALRDPGRLSSSCRGLGVYEGMLYFTDDNILYRLPVKGPGQAEVLLSVDHQNLFPLQFKDGEIVTGRFSLLSIDPFSSKVTYVAEDIVSQFNGFWSLFFQKDDLYLGTFQGVMVLDYPALQGGEMQLQCSDTVVIPHRSIYQFAPLDDQRLFVVTSDGLFIMTKKDCRAKQVEFLDEHGKSRRIIHFTHIDPDSEGMWWVTTLDAGLIRFDLRDSVAHTISTLDIKDKVVTNAMYASYDDGLGYRWISSDQGLIRLRLEDQTFYTYTAEDGLPGNEFNRMSYTRDPQGNLYFGGLNGVVGFNPGDFPPLGDDIPMRLLDLQQHSGWRDTILNRTSEVRASHTIDMRSSDRYFSLKVGLLDYYKTGNHTYSYRIAGMHDAWQPMNGNTLFVSALPYGIHELSIRGHNATGILSKNTLDLTVIVRYPFYLQWWFILAMLLGIGIVAREWWLSRTRRMRRYSEKLEKEVAERTHTIEKQADELRQLQEMRSRFFANISHELRTPLTLIKGPLASLRKKRGEDEDKAYLELIAYNADLLHERIDDLLALARADAGRLEINQTPIELHGLLDRIIDSLRGEAMRKEIHLELKNQLSPSLVFKADRKKLEQILSNLIGNAIKFSGPSTIVTLECIAVNGKLQFCVSDQGPGIPEVDLERIFERFYQVSKSHAEMGGTGIGLALSREFARAMGGEVWATSVLGEGSRLWLSLPFQPVETPEKIEMGAEEHSMAPELTTPVSTDHATSGVMLVEDNSSMRAFLEKELGRYAIESHADGQSALDALRELAGKQSLPGVVITDVMMPVMNGIELLKNIRSDPELAGIPVVMLTARAGKEDKLEALRIGVDDYITKPFEVDELLVRIDNILARTSGKQEARRVMIQVNDRADATWLYELEEIVKENIRDTNFNIARLAEELFVSESTLHRRVKATTGLTPNNYLREVRLFEARRLLDSGEVATVAELSFAVGFETPDYFSRIFLQRFGYKPSQRI